MTGTSFSKSSTVQPAPSAENVASSSAAFRPGEGDNESPYYSAVTLKCNLRKRIRKIVLSCYHSPRVSHCPRSG